MKENQVAVNISEEAKEFYYSLPVSVRLKVRDSYVEKLGTSIHIMYRRLKGGLFTQLEYDFIKKEAEKIINS